VVRPDGDIRNFYSFYVTNEAGSRCDGWVGRPSDIATVSEMEEIVEQEPARAKVAYVDRVGTPSEARRQGQAREVLAATLQRLDKMGVTATYLFALPDHDEGVMDTESIIRWYGRFGFKKVTSASTDRLLRRARPADVRIA
jgi:ribosomal protein S18 acetylase RimI-like enzyme